MYHHCQLKLRNRAKKSLKKAGEKRATGKRDQHVCNTVAYCSIAREEACVGLLTFLCEPFSSLSLSELYVVAEGCGRKLE